MNATTFAISSGVEFPSGDITFRSAFQLTPSGMSMNAFWSGVSMPPGATQFTRTPLRRYSSARQRVRCTTPAFDAQYAAENGCALIPAFDAMFTIEPPPSRRCGSAARHTRNVPVRLTASVRCHSSTGSSCVWKNRPIPAQFTTTRGCPRSRHAPATASCTESASETSTLYARATPPCSAMSTAVFSAPSTAMSKHATGAPSLARSSAVARPNPDPAPVMSATRPSNRPMKAEDNRVDRETASRPRPMGVVATQRSSVRYAGAGLLCAVSTIRQADVSDHAGRAVLAKREDRFTTITMSRPQRRNALSKEHMAALLSAFRSVGESDARGVVLAGNGPVFCSGHDFADVAGADLQSVRALVDLCIELMETIQTIPQVVIARVHGLATAAGCQLVGTADLAVAADTAQFAIPGGRTGWFCHTPLVAVARNVGRKRALEMAFTGEPIDARTAADWGLINAAVPPDQLEAA